MGYPSAEELKGHVHCRGVVRIFGKHACTRNDYADLAVLLLAELGVVNVVNLGVRLQCIVHTQEFAVVVQVLR